MKATISVCSVYLLVLSEGERIQDTVIGKHSQMGQRSYKKSLDHNDLKNDVKYDG